MSSSCCTQPSRAARSPRLVSTLTDAPVHALCLPALPCCLNAYMARRLARGSVADSMRGCCRPPAVVLGHAACRAAAVWRDRCGRAPAVGHLQGGPATAGAHQDQAPPPEADQAVLEGARQLHYRHGLPPDGAHADQCAGQVPAQQDQGQTLLHVLSLTVSAALLPGLPAPLRDVQCMH